MLETAPRCLQVTNDFWKAGNAVEKYKSEHGELAKKKENLGSLNLTNSTPRVPSLQTEECSESFRGFHLFVCSWHLVTKILVAYLPTCSLSVLVSNGPSLSIPWPAFTGSLGNNDSVTPPRG